MRVAAIVTAAVLGFTGASLAQTATEPAQGQASTPAAPSFETIPVDTARIRRDLRQRPARPLRIAQTTFYVDVYGRKPAPEWQWHRHVPGPWPTTNSFHREFLAMVTPRIFSSSEVVAPLDTISAGLQRAAVLWAVKKSAAAIRRAHARRIRREIEEELREYTNRLQEPEGRNER